MANVFLAMILERGTNDFRFFIMVHKNIFNTARDRLYPNGSY